MPSESTCFILNEPPHRDVNFDLKDDKSTFKLVKRSLRPLKEGEILIKTLYLSNDPTQRAWIQKGLNADRMYTAPVLKGDIMRSTGLGEVVESRHSKYRPGEVVSCDLKWADYSIIKQANIFNKVENTKVPLTWYLDVLGMTGLTAYFGLLDVAKLKATDTIVISAASGATGSMCVQIAKKVIGCKRVIGISGGADKCRYVESIGADVCVDYKDPKFYSNLKKALGEEKYADVFFDGVGGQILDAMLTLVKPFGKIIACGAIAGYNNIKGSSIVGWPQIVVMRLQVLGFIILDYQNQYELAIKDIVRWIGEGKIKVDKDSFSLVDLSNNFEKIPETWGMLFSSQKGPGKLLTKL
ncbi:quinone oxidoreductase [Suhomyces tanzawaensis NRRL Y-17324]|uniref:Quinone oxidoreductase n=1 Tax=Suhomyces tanzawaensis NRRL Y-17324 TaxID=984487 RepID=A0A1E4SEV6_9ASCO|nr:quinone oxidoreductase [Suhomyces tanzawaensis NRRL Y-17324]ODV78051.1 quinone oxidoreductase [Suhomyces tanzawaensis NRRL Y-17324]